MRAGRWHRRHHGAILPCPALSCPALGLQTLTGQCPRPLPGPALHLQILTGQCAHNSGVIGAALPPLSGFFRFQARGLENQTVPYFLHAAGYRTGLTGKVGGARGPWGVGWV